MKQIIEAAHDAGYAPLEYRFINPRGKTWSPFCDRFKRAKWMKWPWPRPEREAQEKEH